MSKQRQLYRETHRQPHGLTLDEARVFKLGKPCGICGHLDSDAAMMRVDHDHVTGEIRVFSAIDATPC